MTRNHETERLFARLRKNFNFKNQKKVFAKHFGPFVWFVTDDPDKIPSDFEEARLKTCKYCKFSKSYREKCDSRLKNIMKKARSIKRIVSFSCPPNLYGFCYPIVQGEKVYGYIMLCRIRKEPSSDMMGIFSAFTDTIVKEVQKELELQKLYETIRPRAIALSTVHTLHRLISSTLDLSELLPRVARLSLQIIRANRCSIKLVDSKRKILLPKATVDLRKKKARLKKVRIGKWAPGKSVKFAKSIRGRDYLATPLIDEDVIGVITIYDKIDKKPFTDFDEEIMRTLCEQAVIAIKNAQLYKEQEKLTLGAIKSIAAILETKSGGTLLPKDSFLKIVHIMGQELRLSEHELKSLQYATLLHDAGQVVLPDKVMKKRGLLTGREYKLIKEHPRKAALILKPLKSLKSVVPIILHHHESFDGEGYPSGLKGSNIPLGARIMGVVGAFEAMITKKSYRKVLSIKEAINEIKKHSGRQFDPKVVDAFLKTITRKDVLNLLKKEIYAAKKSHK